MHTCMYTILAVLLVIMMQLGMMMLMSVIVVPRLPASELLMSMPMLPTISTCWCTWG